MSLYKYLGIFLLKIISIRYATAQKTPCSELLSAENQEGDGVIGTLFQYAPTGTCFVCTKEQSPGDDMSGVEIPVYNNVFDFGLNGKYFPMTINTTIKMNEECSLKITASKPPESPESDLSIKISSCSKSSESECEETSFSKSIGFEFSNWNCLSVAVAFVEKQIYAKITSRCQHLASSGFNDSDYINITDEKCFIDDKTDLHATIKTQHSEGYEYDGFPVMLPCSPGGYAVDPFTGRFTIDDQCYRFFRYLPRFTNKDGIIFLIQKVYKNNENLLFPKKAKIPYDVKPVYIQDNGEPSSKEEMKAKEERNLRKGYYVRNYCNYGKENCRYGCNGNETKKVCKIRPCEELLKKMKEHPSRGSLNYYIHRNGCFLCSKPNCDFRNEECNKTSEIKDFPLYNNLIEFGIPALHFPINTIVEIKITKECYYKVEIQHASDLVVISIFECLSSLDNCTELLKDSERWEFHLGFNNYYCVYVALAFRSDPEIHFATSDICKKFASVEFQSNRTLKRQNEACAFSGKKLSAEFKFIHTNSCSYSGVPIILPCSTGGVLVDPKEGSFIRGPSCRKMVWDSDIREKGVEFVINKFYDNNENYLFKTEQEANVKYPIPIYSEDGSKFIPFDEGVPKIDPNKEKGENPREGCNYTESEKTTTIKSTTVRSRGEGATKKPVKIPPRIQEPKPPKDQEKKPSKTQTQTQTQEDQPSGNKKRDRKTQNTPPPGELHDDRGDYEERGASNIEQTSEACYATFDIMILLFVGLALTL